MTDGCFICETLSKQVVNCLRAAASPKSLWRWPTVCGWLGSEEGMEPRSKMLAKVDRLLGKGKPR